jgi:hypothetical protein
MHIVIATLGAIWIGAGLLLWTAARLFTHEIFACMLVSFGVAFLGIAVVIDAINRVASAKVGEPRHPFANS